MRASLYQTHPSYVVSQADHETDLYTSRWTAEVTSGGIVKPCVLSARGDTLDRTGDRHLMQPNTLP